MHDYIRKGNLYKFVDTLRGEDNNLYIVIALESEEVFSWKNESPEDCSIYDLVTILKNDVLDYAWTQDLEEIEE
tara:strand:- start:179 stop:400 length:222 start_codon:yes stop_codon:yes gene_type:complete